MGYSKRDISSINMLCFLKKSVIFNTPLPPDNSYLSTTATFFCSKVVERFDSSQLDRILSEGISSVSFEFEVLHGPTRLSLL